MSIQINGYNVIDNSRNVTTTAKVTSSTCNVPVGTTPARPGSPVTGSIRYNTTNSAIEYYNGSMWMQLKSYSALSFSARGVYGHGFSPSAPNTSNMQYITISSASNTTPFGTLSYAAVYSAACASTTRGVFSAGYTVPAFRSDIVYITIASTSNSTPFGTLSTARGYHFGTSNATIGLFGGGITPATIGSVQQITIATTGNSTTYSTLPGANSDIGALSTPTTAYVTGGSGDTINIYYSSYPSAGAWTSFGSLASPAGRYAHVTASDQVRGLIISGVTGSNVLQTDIQYMTFSTLSNTSSWGNISTSRTRAASTCTPTRAVIAGGNNNGGTYYSSMESIDNYQSRGSSSPFGSLSSAIAGLSGLSNGHSGLGY